MRLLTAPIPRLAGRTSSSDPPAEPVHSKQKTPPETLFWPYPPGLGAGSWYRGPASTLQRSIRFTRPSNGNPPFFYTSRIKCDPQHRFTHWGTRIGASLFLVLLLLLLLLLLLVVVVVVVGCCCCLGWGGFQD